MRPYVIKQGDHLAALAYVFGFDAETVWSHPANKALRQQRPDPRLLCPCDILYIPDDAGLVHRWHALRVGQDNAFVCDLPLVTLRIRFRSHDPAVRFAQRRYVVEEYDLTEERTTDAEGVATFEVPVTQKVATLAFREIDVRCTVHVGGLDPIDTPSGVHHRLINLGVLDRRPLGLDGSEISETLRQGLRYLVAMQDVLQPPNAGVRTYGESSLANTGKLHEEVEKWLLHAHGS